MVLGRGALLTGSIGGWGMAHAAPLPHKTADTFAAPWMWPQGSSGARTSPFGQAITARGVRSMLAHAVRHGRRRRR
jgi:hypothetical protein